MRVAVTVKAMGRISYLRNIATRTVTYGADFPTATIHRTVEGELKLLLDRIYRLRRRLAQHLRPFTTSLSDQGRACRGQRPNRVSADRTLVTSNNRSPPFLPTTYYELYLRTIMSTLASAPPPSSVLHRNLAETPHHAVSSSGINITLSTSQSIIDATGGASTAVLGHTQPSVISAVSKQMSAISYVFSGAGYTSSSAEDLANLVVGDNQGFKKAIFVCSGSEAMEAALKLARQYHCERGDIKRTRFISRNYSYHGNTLGALGVSGHPGRRVFYEHMLAKNVSFVDACYTYRGKKEGEDDAAYLQRLIQGVENEFSRVGAEVVAFIAETMSGASLGCATALPGYFQAVREICDQYGALLILDEVHSTAPRDATS